MARLINADTLIAWIKGSQQMTSKMKSIICYIKTMPTIEARPKGEWQMDEDDDIYHCSKCFFEIDASGCIDPTEYISIYNFCPNCGSDNRERNDDE